MNHNIQIIRKWYEKLGFPAHFDELFEDSLKRHTLPDDMTLARYSELVASDKDVEENFLILLFLLEELQQWFHNRGISDEIFMDTMKDLILWAEDYHKQSGGVLGIEREVGWLKTYYDGRFLEYLQSKYWLSLLLVIRLLALLGLVGALSVRIPTQT